MFTEHAFVATDKPASLVISKETCRDVAREAIGVVDAIVGDWLIEASMIAEAKTTDVQQFLAAVYPVKPKRRNLPWMADALKELVSLGSLEQDWDGYDADVPRPDAIEAARRFLATLAADAHLAAPYIEPLRSGGILLGWEGDNRRFEIRIHGRDKGSYVHLVKGDDHPSRGDLFAPGGAKQVRAILREHFRG